MSTSYFGRSDTTAPSGVALALSKAIHAWCPQAKRAAQGAVAGWAHATTGVTGATYRERLAQAVESGAADGERGSHIDGECRCPQAQEGGQEERWGRHV